MTDYSILNRPKYFSELARKIHAAKSGEQLALATMNLEPWDPGVNKIMDALTKASTRGVKAILIVDAYSFMAGGNMFTPGPLFWHKALPKRLSKQHDLKLKVLEEFKAAGGSYKIINSPTRRFTMPFKGRSHIKFAVIDDYIYIGNCNLDKQDQIDLMIGWQDAKAAGWLQNFAQDLIKTGSVGKALATNSDQEFRLSPGSQLVIDVGRPDQSLIFKEALNLIDSAQESVVFVCQYFPDKTVLDHLVAAHKRGVNVRLIYNHPLNRAPILALAHSLNKAKNRLTRPSILFKYQLPRHATYLHAKLLATDQAVMIGSHNFVEAGVKFGTAEIALFSQDQDLRQQTIEQLEKQLPTSLRS